MSPGEMATGETMKEPPENLPDDDRGHGPFGARYRVIKPGRRRPAESFTVEDLGDGGRRRHLRLTEDRSDIRAAAESARRVVHDRIAGLHRVDVATSGQLILVGDPVDGETLAERVGRLGPQSESWIIQTLGGIARALDQAHAAGVPHGSLRPQMILIDEAGQSALLGLAVEAAIRNGDGGLGPGTAPELTPGAAPTTASDVYAFGAVVFEALHGRAPSSRDQITGSDSTSEVAGRLESEVIRQAIDLWLGRALDPDPTRRPRSCGDLLSFVESALQTARANRESSREMTASGPGRVRNEYATPLDLLELESAIADVVPRKSRLALIDHPAVRGSWDKGEHFLSTGAVYKQLQQWQTAGEALERARVEFDAGVAMDAGLVVSRERHRQLEERLESMVWNDHPETAALRERVRQLLDDERGGWKRAWDEGRLADAANELDAAEAAIHEASFLNREIGSATEWRTRWRDLSLRIPDRVLDQRWVGEIRDHRAAGRRAEEAIEQRDFATAGGIWSTRLERLAEILELEAGAYESAMAARRRFDESVGRAPKSRPISRELREALARLAADSDEIEKSLIATGAFEAAGRRWTDGAASMGTLIQQDIERFGRMESAREQYEKVVVSRQPRRASVWTRLGEELEAIRKLVTACSNARDGGDFEAAARGWAQARERLERAQAADVERHHEAILACERFGRRLDTLPPRLLDRTVRADVTRLQQRRGVLDDWMIAGRFTEVEDAVRRAIDSINSALEIDGRLHDAAVTARDRAVAINVEFPPQVPQPVLDAMKPAFAEIDAAAVQARQAYELGEYGDCAEAWNRTVDLKQQATVDMQRETDRYERRRRRRAVIRATASIATVVLIALVAVEVFARLWVGSIRKNCDELVTNMPGLEVQKQQLIARIDALESRPVVAWWAWGEAPHIQAEIDVLGGYIGRSEELQSRFAALKPRMVGDDWPVELQNRAEQFNQNLDEADDRLQRAAFDGLGELLSQLEDEGPKLSTAIGDAETVHGKLKQVSDVWDKTPAVERASDDRWGKVETSLKSARDFYDRNRLANARSELDDAETIIREIGTDKQRQVAENARREFRDLWEAPEYARFRTVEPDTTKSIEKADLNAERAFAAKDFPEAADDWQVALKQAQGLQERHGEPLEKFDLARSEWDNRSTEFDYLRDDPAYAATFKRAAQEAADAERAKDKGQYEPATEYMKKAKDTWDRALKEIAEDFASRWAILQDESKPPQDRFEAAAWLLKKLEEGSEQRSEVAFLRDRLEWQTQPPEKGMERDWPIDRDRRISMTFVTGSRNVRMRSPEAQRTVELSGYWISTRPVTLAEIGLAGDGFATGRSHQEASDLAHRFGSAAALGLLGDVPGIWRFRLPTETEWVWAIRSNVVTIERGVNSEWCRDRWAEAGPFVHHLVESNPGGPSTGDRHVVHQSEQSRRPTPAALNGVAFRIVLSPVHEPAVIRAEELEGRADPRLAGVREPWVVERTKSIRFGDQELDFVEVEMGEGKTLWVATTEVTQGIWKAVMGDLPRQPELDPMLPVVDVSGIDIETFQKRVRERLKLDVRLPTAEEWRRAAAAGEPDSFCFGDEAPLRHLRSFAWYSDNSDGRPHPVGDKNFNRWGLYDVHGNVAERCAPDRVNMNDIRGGSFQSKLDECRLDRSDRCMSSEKHPWLGFRLVANKL